MLKSLQFGGRASRVITAALLLAVPALAAPPGPAPKGNERASAPQRSYSGDRPHSAQPQRPQPHLGEWMQSHQNLSPKDQERALQKEPGFKSLPQPQQQRLANRLHDLNNLPPNVRQRFLNRTEALERLSPDQRQQVRGAMQNMSILPADRQRVVGQTFRELRNLPPDQREGALNSDRYRGQLSDQERQVLNGLFQVGPMLPTSHDERGYRPPPQQ